MNIKKILKVFFLVTIILVISFLQLSGQIQRKNSDNEIINDSNSGILYITDISFEGLKIIATIKSIDANYRTIWIDFYKSRIVNENPTEPVLIGSNFASIKQGQTIYVPKLWLGFGHYIISVKIINHAELSQEVLWFVFTGIEIN